MFVKQANGKVFGAQFTKKEQQAIDIEVRKLVAEQNDVYNKDLDAVLLFALRQEFGFGKKRLEQFFNAAKQIAKTYHEQYQSKDTSLPEHCKSELLKIGVDLDRLEGM